MQSYAEEDTTSYQRLSAKQKKKKKSLEKAIEELKDRPELGSDIQKRSTTTFSASSCSRPTINKSGRGKGSIITSIIACWDRQSLGQCDSVGGVLINRI